MKNIITMIIILLMCSIMMSACTTQSVEDVYKMTNAEDATKRGGYENNQSVDSTKKPETEEHFDTVAEMNEKVIYGGFELTVEQAWITNDFQILTELEGDSEYKNFITNEINTVKDELVLDEDGAFTNEKYQWMFIRMKLKFQENNGETKRLCIYPLFYKYVEDRGLSNIKTIEPSTFDKYKNLKESENYHKDALYYIFEKNEEIETIVAFICNVNTPYDNLYMSAKFLDAVTADVNMAIPSDCPIIKISNIQRLDEE